MEIGKVNRIFRYPVKSMAGEELDRCLLGLHGLEGDRRLAFRRVDDPGGFPWLTAGRLPELILYKPFCRDEHAENPVPTHIRTPDGREFELRDEELRDELSRRFGREVQLMQLNHGIFDEAALSVISIGTISSIEHDSAKHLDIRRFRPNIVVETITGQPFEEDGWIGKTICFGENGERAEAALTLRDTRCAMINLDPDTAQPDPVVLKSVVRMNANCAGLYGTVTKAGGIAVGQKLFLKASANDSKGILL